jgi:hypothetical protein
MIEKKKVKKLLGSYAPSRGAFEYHYVPLFNSLLWNTFTMLLLVSING